MEATTPAAAHTTTVVIMGVSGSGKTTVARGLAERLGWDFAEGDDFHPPANVAKMRSGRSLDDSDRWPWLDAIADWIGRREADGASAVVSCSALKRAYRDRLRHRHPSVKFVHMDVPPAIMRQRLLARTGHYMPTSLLESQLAALEQLGPDEPGFATLGAGEPAEVVTNIRQHLGTGRHRRSASG